MMRMAVLYQKRKGGQTNGKFVNGDKSPSAWLNCRWWMVHWSVCNKISISSRKARQDQLPLLPPIAELFVSLVHSWWMKYSSFSDLHRNNTTSPKSLDLYPLLIHCYIKLIIYKINTN
jgi:hypothetical protein